MGTRSLLAYEKTPGKYYVQYMQFDGNPQFKGKEFYEGVVTGLYDGMRLFIDKNGNPTNKFRTKILHFLNNYQYASGHSIDSHWTIDAKDWENQDSCQEWQYLWKFNGDFSFFHTYGNSSIITIPWAITREIAKNFYDDGKICGYFEDKNLNDTENWDKGIPTLRAIWGEKLCFPDQKKAGYRSFVKICKFSNGEGETILAQSDFAAHNLPMRNIASCQTVIEKA